MQFIAYISMFIDHVCKFAFHGFAYNPLLGRLAMPIFAYLIATGMKRTSNKHKYILRLFIFAIISQVPYILMIRGAGNWSFNSSNLLQIINHYTQSFNIGFTFLIATLSIYFIDKNKDNLLNVFIIVVISLFVATELKTDYDVYGVLTIYMFYFFKEKRNIFLGYLALTTFYIFRNSLNSDFSLDGLFTQRLKSYFSLLSFPIIFWVKENKRRDSKAVKLLKYAIYPAHMLAIYLFYSMS